MNRTLTDAMIKTEKLSKKYRTEGGVVHALSEATLAVGRGEFVAVTGESGSGKTTLMNLLGCLDSATSGEYYLDGENVSRLCPGKRTGLRNRKIAFVFQGFNLLPALTAAENAALPLIYRGLPKRAALEKAEDALAMVGLSMRSAHKPAELSGGQQQRVAVARAIAADTPVILADEPCGSLDSRSGLRVMELLHEEHRRGKTIVLITHDRAAAKTADRILHVADGRVGNAAW